MSAEDQAQMYHSQGCGLRAAAMLRKLIVTEPTVENLSILAALYMCQGLHEDGQAMYMRAMGQTRVN